MTYLLQLIALFLALFGAFYKNTIKVDENDKPVYYRGFPVLTRLGWVLVTGLILSSALSIYTSYDNAQKAEKEKTVQKDRADELQKTLNNISSTNADILRTQITRFEDLLQNQEAVGKKTIDKISDSSDVLVKNIGDSADLLRSNIDDSSNLLRDNINDSSFLLTGKINNSSVLLKSAIGDSSDLLRKNVLEAALAGRSSVPKIYLSVKKKGAFHDFTTAYEEKLTAEDQNLVIKNRSIGFIPKSVRDVLFPFADNTSVYNSSLNAAISFRIGEYAAQHTVGVSGFVENDITINDSWIVKMETRINGSTNGVPDGDPDLFAFIFQFNNNWAWEEMNEALKNKFSEGRPVMIIERWHVPNAPPSPPVFSQIYFVVILSEHPTFRILMPLEVKNYTYDPALKKYRYELHIAKRPEIITEYTYTKP